MYNVFIAKTTDSKYPYRICDFGLTLMHLSYNFDVDTEHREEILNNIIKNNLGSIDNGNIYIDSNLSNLHQNLLQYYQLLSKVSSMSILKKEVVRSLFYENLNYFVENELSQYNPELGFSPLPDYKVDCRFNISAKRPIYLFGVRDSIKAKEIMLHCMVFKDKKIPFESLVIYEDMNSSNISAKDLRRLTNIADKQYASLEDFKSESADYFQQRCG